MALTDIAFPSAGATHDRPASGARPAAERRTGAFAVLLQGHASESAAPAEAPVAATGTRGAMPAEVATRLADELRGAAELALERAVRSGQTLRTMIEAQGQVTLDAGLKAGSLTADSAASLARQSAERTDWHHPFG